MHFSLRKKAGEVCDVLLPFLLDMFGECFEFQQQGYMVYFASLGISFQTQNTNAFVWF
jgi:hypothetical protein